MYQKKKEREGKEDDEGRKQGRREGGMCVWLRESPVGDLAVGSPGPKPPNTLSGHLSLPPDSFS